VSAVVRSRRAVAALAVTGLLLFPGWSLAAGTSPTPLTPGLPANTGVQPTTPPAPSATGVGTVSTAGGSTLSGSSATGIAVGALVVLVGISLFIWRDARKRAPVRSRAALDGPDGRARTGSKAKTKPRKLSPAERRRRKRGKAR
jgi:hypothetical protein